MNEELNKKHFHTIVSEGRNFNLLSLHYHHGYIVPYIPSIDIITEEKDYLICNI